MSGNRTGSEQASAPRTQVEQGSVAWRVVGASVQGAAHIRVGLPNQDAFIQWPPATGSGPSALAAIADGHGGPTHFRSEVGARFAVETAAAVLRDFCAAHHAAVPAERLDTDARNLPRTIAEGWQAKVSLHAAENLFTKEEWAKLAESAGSDARSLVESNPVLAYGATLLAVLVTESFVLYLQLGDGDILTVDEKGLTVRPLPPDRRLIANQTTSLCQPQAWEDFRLFLDVNPARLPALILLSTDGYANAFRSDDDFLRIGRDYLEILRKADLSQLSTQLKEFLLDASRNGSGDDVTLTLLKRTGVSLVQPSQKEVEVPHPKDSGVEKETQLPPVEQQKRPAEDSEESSKINTGMGSPVRWRFIWGIGIIVVVALLGLGAFLLSREPVRSKSSKVPLPPPHSSPAKPLLVARLGLRIGSGKEIILASGEGLTGAQVGLSGPAASAVIAVVTIARTKTGAVELLNRSKQAWSVTSPDGRHSRIGPGASLPLAKGAKIRFAARAPLAEVVATPKK